VSFARSEIAETFACLGVCCSGSSTYSSSFAASAISTFAKRKYISRVSGFLVFEACRLKCAALSLWKRWRVLTLVPLLNY
jgi:hypothetical protein